MAAPEPVAVGALPAAGWQLRPEPCLHHRTVRDVLDVFAAGGGPSDADRFAPLLSSHAPCTGSAPLVVVDVETTGLDPQAARALEVAAVAVDDSGIPAASWSTLLNPECPFDPGVHGIGPDECRTAPSFAEVAGTLTAWVEGRVVVGYGTRLDAAVIAAEYTHAGLEVPVLPFVDLFELVTFLGLRGLGGRRRLVDVAARLGAGSSAAHRALPDAFMAARVTEHLLQRARFAGHLLFAPDRCVTGEGFGA